MSKLKKLSSQQRSLISYSIGFLGSIALTLTAYYLVVHAVFSGITVAVIIVSLAIVQCLVQLIFFLHLAQEERPRWRLWTLLSMLAIFIVVVFGSIWVMYDLNDRMMPSHEEMMKYMQKQEGF